VTAVVATRDRWPLLRRALRSALAQEQVALEVVVVDDGSRDETPGRLGETVDPRLRVLRNETASGVARARNRGIAAARAPWVAFLDDDDMWAPHKLRLQLREASDGVVLVTSAYVVVDRAGRIERLKRPPSGDLERALLRRNAVGGPSTVLARTAALRAVGGFDERLAILADWDLWLRLLRLGRGAARPEVLAAYTLDPGSMLRAGYEDNLRELRLLEAEHGGGSAGRAFRAQRDAWRALAHAQAGRRGRAAATWTASALRRGDPRDLARAAGALLGERAWEAVKAPGRRLERRAAGRGAGWPGWLDEQPGP
jgi:hypothetical protein